MCARSTTSRAASPTEMDAGDVTLHRCRTRQDTAGARRREPGEVRAPQSRRRRPAVEDLTGQSTVPVLLIEDEAIADSRRIVEHLRSRSDQQAADSPASG